MIFFLPTKKNHILKCVIFTFILFGEHLAAQEIVTDRPDQTEASSTVGNGNLQIETGLLY